MLIVFSPIFVADTKIICNYNFIAPLSYSNKELEYNKPCCSKKNLKHTEKRTELIYKTLNHKEQVK